MKTVYTELPYSCLLCSWLCRPKVNSGSSIILLFGDSLTVWAAFLGVLCFLGGCTLSTLSLFPTGSQQAWLAAAVAWLKSLLQSTHPLSLYKMVPLVWDEMRGYLWSVCVNSTLGFIQQGLLNAWHHDGLFQKGGLLKRWSMLQMVRMIMRGEIHSWRVIPDWNRKWLHGNSL